jgi:hypothetical protein
MKPDELHSLWSADLPEASASGPAFSITRGVDATWVATDEGGRPSLILPLADRAQPARRSVGCIELQVHEALEIRTRDRCEVRPSAVFVLQDPACTRTFSVLCADVIAELGHGELDAATVFEHLASWRELLRSQRLLSRKEELGLWGELTLIELAPDPARMVETWCGPSRKTVDFLANGVAIECKTGLQRRKHRLSHRQAEFTGDRVESYLASLWVADDPSGTTLPEKIEAVRNRLTDDSTLMRCVLEVGFRETDSDKYQRTLALASDLELYPMACVPRVRTYDSGVSDMQYTITLDADVSLPSDVAAGIMNTLCEAVATR